MPWMRAAATQVISHGSIGARPGTRRARVSLARSLVPMTKPESRVSESRAAAAIDRILKIASGVSIIAQILVLWSICMSSRRRPIISNLFWVGDLRHQDRVGRGMSGGGEIVGVPGRIDAVDPDEHLARAEAAGLHGIHHLPPRGFLGVRRHRVLEIEDDAVGGKGLGLLQRAGIGAGHIEHAAARADGHGAFLVDRP